MRGKKLEILGWNLPRRKISHIQINYAFTAAAIMKIGDLRRIPNCSNQYENARNSIKGMGMNINV